MLRDPFYRRIIERLNAPLDPEIFEQAAVELLRVDWPTLVPIRGGTDAGMDGAIADAEGIAFPLVTTIGKKAIGNLTRNLKSYLVEGGTRRKVIFATSRQLTSRQRRNLETRSTELGFVLIQIYDQAAIANLLYHRPEWCKELLDLSGDPAPLSVVPKTERPLLNQLMIGRDLDIDWLRTSNGDKLLVGQPGSGKTFLLRQLSMDGEGLFVVSQDRGEIAAAVRSQSPSILIVDDAQLYPQLILELKQLREATGAEFSILASCWPGDEVKVSERLGIPSTKIHRLDLLTRDQIVGVINGTGLIGPNHLIHEIVDQAEGRPGLAATLSHLCLEGGVREVVYGDRLSDSTIEFYGRSIGSEVKSILAFLSIGGDRGLPIDVVAQCLRMSLVDIREILVRLAAGGVLLEIDERYLSVRPPALRYALIREIFFAGALSLPIDPLLAQVNPRDAAQSLIGAKARGAAVPDDFLLRVVSRVDSDEIWHMYASIGRNEAKWVLENFPERMTRFPRIFLHYVPEETIPLLLQASVADHRPLHSHPEHPLRIVQDWVYSGQPGTPEAVERRNLLFRSTRLWLLKGNNIDTALRSFQIALSPEYKFISSDPGSGMTITIQRGCLTEEELPVLQLLWNELWEILEGRQVDNWAPLRDAIEIWAFPVRVAPELPKAEFDIIQEIALDLLETVATLAQGQSGLLRWVGWIAKELNAEIEVPLADDFAILYPYEDRENWQEWEARQKEAVGELASKWVHEDVGQVVQRILSIEQEATKARLDWPRLTPLLCEYLANLVSSPCTWLSAILESDLGGDLIYPFLRRAAEIDEAGWIDMASSCLGIDHLKKAAIAVILTHPNSPRELVGAALLHLDGHAQTIKIMCLRKEILEDRVRELLNHEDSLIARAAAEGEWLSNSNGTVRYSLSNDWRRVVVQYGLEDHTMQRILKTDAEIAYDWLRVRIDEQMPHTYRLHRDRPSAVEVAIGQLSTENRIRLLDQIAEIEEELDFEFSYLIPLLVGNNPNLYAHVLSDERLRYFHLTPFESSIDQTWIQLAVMALDAGYTKEQIANSAFPSFWSWSGNTSDMWAEFSDKFGILLQDTDERIREIGMIARRRALASQEQALKQERREAIYGGFQ